MRQLKKPPLSRLPKILLLLRLSKILLLPLLLLVVLLLLLLVVVVLLLVVLMGLMGLMVLMVLLLLKMPLLPLPLLQSKMLLLLLKIPMLLPTAFGAHLVAPVVPTIPASSPSATPVPHTTNAPTSTTPRERSGVRRKLMLMGNMTVCGAIASSALALLIPPRRWKLQTHR
jgi:hypothetical protein